MEEELERTFLAKYLPGDLYKFPSKEMSDNYIPKESKHPILRIRKNGDKFEATKKYQKTIGESSVMVEETIKLSEEEFNALNKIEGKRHSKKRYNYSYKGIPCEIDIYQGDLKGLVVVDFEFPEEEKMKNFEMPDFCLAEITNEEFTAGGFLCGKTYEEIKENLDKYDYKKLKY